MSGKNILKKLMILGNDRKKNSGIHLVSRKRSCMKESGLTTEEEGSGSSHSFAR